LAFSQCNSDIIRKLKLFLQTTKLAMLLPVLTALLLSAIDLSNGVNVEIPDDLYTADDPGCTACRLLDLLCGGPPKPAATTPPPPPPPPPFKCTVDLLAWGWNDNDTNPRVGYLKANGVTALNTTYLSSMTYTTQWSRGVNLGVLNVQSDSCSVSNLKNFDTMASTADVQGVQDYIKALPDKTLLLAVTDDSTSAFGNGVDSLTPANSVLEGIGFKTVSDILYGWKWALIAEIGHPDKTQYGLKPPGSNLNLVVDVVPNAITGDVDFNVITNT